MRRSRSRAPLCRCLACWSLARGQAPDWDFRNYHWYNAYAWLNGRRGFDVAVAHHATYYNPLADVPVYVAAQILPAWCVVFLVGCIHGLTLLLVYRIARAALPRAYQARATIGSRSRWRSLARRAA